MVEEGGGLQRSMTFDARSNEPGMFAKNWSRQLGNVDGIDLYTSNFSASRYRGEGSSPSMHPVNQRQ